MFVAVVASGTGGRPVPVAAGPDRTLGINGDVLSNIAPAVFLRVYPPHRLNGVGRRAGEELRVVWPPCVVHVDVGDLPLKREYVQQRGKLVEGERLERLGHGFLTSCGHGRREDFDHVAENYDSIRYGSREGSLIEREQAEGQIEPQAALCHYTCDVVLQIVSERV